MRLARYRRDGGVSTGVVDVDGLSVTPVEGELVDLLGDPDSVRPRGDPVATADIEFLAPVPRPAKYFAIGMNYADHIAELGREAPEFPVFFNKQVSCVVGPGEAIEIPRESEMVDYEGELAMVIGRRCRRVPAGSALDVVGGFTVVNDVSVRDWQLRSPTMTLGKSWDTHGPTGPWVVTGDEIGDPHDLELRTWVNDQLMQDASTGDMIFDCRQQVETLSTVCTLEPGDLIATGTPAGVGAARQPPRWLQPGDTVRVQIEGVGTLENPVIGPT